MGRKGFYFFIVAIFLYVASPLIVPIAMGAVFATIFYPIMERLERKKVSNGLASGLLTMGLTLCFLLPVAVLTFFAARTGLQQFRVWKDAPKTGGGFFHNLVNTPSVHTYIEKVSSWFPIDFNDVLSTSEDLARTIGLKIGDALGNILTQIPSMSMALAIMVLSIFFFLADGRKLLHFLRQNSLLSKRQTERLIGSVAGMCRSVVLATVVSGFVQAFVFSIVCIFVGVPNVALLGFLVFLASFIPLIGSFPITIGVVFHQLLLGNKSGAVVLFIAAMVVGVADNFIRPLVIKGSANLHPLLAFIAAFGGLQMLGVSGVFLGPIVAGLFVVTVKNLMHGDLD